MHQAALPSASSGHCPRTLLTLRRRWDRSKGDSQRVGSGRPPSDPPGANVAKYSDAGELWRDRPMLAALTQLRDGWCGALGLIAVISRKFENLFVILCSLA